MGFYGQYAMMFLILIKLKSWRFLFMAVVLLALASNLFLYGPVDSWMLRLGQKSMQIIGGKEFQEENVVLSDKSKYDVQLAVISKAVKRMSGVDFESNNLESCSSNANCRDKFFQMLCGKRQGKFAHYIDYNSTNGGKAKLWCQMSTGSELYCPFMAYLVGISQPKDPVAEFQYRKTFVFRLLSSVTNFPTNKRKSDTMCAKDVNFPAVFPRVLMAQMILVVFSLIFYLLVSSVSCLAELKHCGLLQLMYRRELSVWSFWLALWTITLLEMAIFASFVPLMHYLQCPGFYATSRLTRLFLLALLQFSGVASVIFLLTVVANSRIITTIFSSAYCIVAVAFIVVNRLVIAGEKSMQWLRYVFLIVPVGHITEQVLAELLSGLIPANKFIGIVLPVSGTLFALLLIVTIYLDCVCSSGNGLLLPCGFLFQPRYWRSPDKKRAEDKESPESVLIERVSREFTPIVNASELFKMYKTCTGDSSRVLINFSAVFHQDQISAIVGHNGSGKSTLMQILAGECRPTQGTASAFNISITDPLSRYHVKNRIGYCPQSNALCDRLTVIDTLKLAAVSSGLSWADVQLDTQNVLSTLQIDNKINQCICSLSSSDKRKVSVVMALIGEPLVLLLDDPSRDMDYISKRKLWGLLHEYKRGHTVIVSTLSIDEADVIADRMLFLSGGKIICAGSSFFFRRAFDCRFIIQVASKTEAHVPYMLRKITSKFHTVRVRSIARADLELELPLTEDAILPAVAEEIERMSELVEEFGIAHYSLDDVFSKLKSLEVHEIQEHFQQGTIGYVADDGDRIMAIRNRPPDALPDGPTNVQVSSSKPRTILAMLRVHCKQLSRSKERLLVRLLVPIVLLVLLVVAALLEKGIKNEEKKVIFNLGETKDFEKDKGACFYYSAAGPIPHMDTVQDYECISILTGINRTTTTIKAVNLPMQRFEQGKFMQAILDRKNLGLVKKLCSKIEKPCPIVYSNDWCPDRKIVENHDFYIGSYVNSAFYTAEDVAMTSIEIHKNVMFHMSRKFLREANRSVQPNFDTDGILDMNSIFFPFYGLFIHIAILAIIPAFCLNDIVLDKTRGIRSQLTAMGTSSLHYWLSTLIHHWIQLAIIYLPSVILLIVIIAKGYTNALFLAGAFLPTLIFGLLNSILCVYIVSSFVNTAGYVVILVYTSFCLLAAMSVLVIQTNDLVGQIMIFLLPQFATIAPSFYAVRFIYYSLAFYANAKMPQLLSYIFTVPHTRDALIALVVHFVLLIVLLIVVESRHKFHCRNGADDQPEEKAYENCTEPAIVEEVNELQRNPRNEANLMEVKQLKVANSSGAIKLRNVTFGLKPGEVLGLVGPCGAGKGSAVRAIVGIQSKTAGQVDFQVKEHWLSCASAAEQGFIGYCPKYNPLLERLTVRENLEFYANVIGVPQERVQLIVRKFHLDDDANTVVLYATAGVKRRLTLAIATLANPKFLAMDQASAGVDPEGRKLLWQNVKSLCGKQRSMLVATQEMEEAETLCNRVCILNGGLMVTLSTVDELVYRYKRMYFLELQISSSTTEPLESVQQRKSELVDIVTQRFIGAIVIDRLTPRIQLAIPIKSIGRLSAALSWLLRTKKELNLLYFSMHYATIDQTMKAIVVHDDCKTVQQHENKGAASISV